MKISQRMYDISEEYEVLDTKYNGVDSDTSEVVYVGTKEECNDFIGINPNNRYLMQEVDDDPH
jgi:hypothetical protein